MGLDYDGIQYDPPTRASSNVCLYIHSDGRDS